MLSLSNIKMKKIHSIFDISSQFETLNNKTTIVIKTTIKEILKKNNT
jgi:hypothetical protein